MNSKSGGDVMCMVIEKPRKERCKHCGGKMWDIGAKHFWCENCEHEEEGE